MPTTRNRNKVFKFLYRPFAGILYRRLILHILLFLLPIFVLLPNFLLSDRALASDCIPNQFYGIANNAQGTSNDIRIVNITTGKSTSVTISLFPTFAIARDATSGYVYYVEAVENNPRVAYWDPITNTQNTVGNGTSTNGITFNKLAQKANPADIYAMAGGSNNLYVINKTTGVAQELGTISGLPNVTGDNPGGGDIAFDPTDPTGNTLFITITDPFSRNISLYKANVSTLTATLVGNSTVTGVGSASLAFGFDGNLYTTANPGGTPNFYRLDKNTGSATLISDTGGVTFNDFATLPTLSPTLSIRVTKTSGRSGISPGNPITYTITLTNTAGCDAIGITLADNVVADINLSNWSSTITPPGTGSVTPPSGTTNPINPTLNLRVGSTATFTVNGTLSPTPSVTILTNTASATLPDGINPPPGTPRTVTATDSIPVILPSNPAGTKSVRLVTDADNSGSITTGDTVEYTITYTNNNPTSNVNDFLVTDTLPNGVSFVSGSYTLTTSGAGTVVTKNDSYNSTTDNRLNTSGVLGANGGKVVFTFRAAITAPGGTVVNNQAVGTTSSQPPVVTQSPFLTNAVSGPGDVPQPPSNGTGNPTQLPVGGAAGGGTGGPAHLRLVKRITNLTRNGATLGGVNFNGFVSGNADDTAPGWPANFLLGVANVPPTTSAQSGDEIEYTIYYLSDGGQDIQNARFCDLLPSGTTFSPDSFASGRGISLNRSGVVSSLTNVADADEGTFFSPLAPLPADNTCSSQNNPDGAVIVNVGTIPSAAGSNYGFVRFRVNIK